MGKDFYEYSDEVRGLYELASDEIGEDIARLSFEGPAEELKRTRFTQPAILLHSLAILTVLKHEAIGFDYAAGHSLGEYGALAAVGALSFEDAVRAVVKRASLMEDACVRNPGTMAAVMGLSEEQIKDVCFKAAEAGVVVPANFNSSNQIVLSGAVPAVEKGAELAKEAGAKRAVMLEVGGAFHSPLMEPARQGLAEYLNHIEFRQPGRPIIANVTATEVTDPEEIKQLLVDQITRPVRWAQTMSYLADNDVSRVIEIGPGKVLSGLAKREMKPESLLNLDTLEQVSDYAPTVSA
jgi:[acyl-carrier-protein] S-malonyltransferase